MKTRHGRFSHLPPLNTLYWLSDGRRAGRAGLTDLYSERLQLTNLLRLTAPDSRIHARAKERLVEIESADGPIYR